MVQLQLVLVASVMDAAPYCKISVAKYIYNIYIATEEYNTAIRLLGRGDSEVVRAFPKRGLTETVQPIHDCYCPSGRSLNFNSYVILLSGGAY